MGVLTAAAPNDQKPNAAQAPDKDALALVQDLLSQRPAKELLLEGTLQLRRSDGRRVAIPLKYAVQLNGDAWRSVYDASATPNQGAELLTVIHNGEQPNRYLLTQISLDQQKTNSMTLTGAEATVPFAGSDFQLTDLGMEFLHWPEQRLVRNAKITMRLGRPCKVLESVNPAPGEATYSRVVSWIDAETGSLIYAEGYDLQNKRFKVFSLHGFHKINGHWQVGKMELRNDKKDTRTALEFKFEDE